MAIIQLPDWYDVDPYDQLAKTCSASGPLGEHVNWGLVTYEGQAKWDSWSKPSDISLDPRHPDWPVKNDTASSLTDLGDANAFPLVNGELHLRWTQQPTTAATAITHGRLGVSDLARVSTLLNRRAPAASPEPEEAFAKRYASLPATTRDKIKQALVSHSIKTPWVAVQATNLRQAPSGFVAQPRIAVRALHKGRIMPNLRKKDLYGRVGTILRASP
jgi:hypothetical protein